MPGSTISSTVTYAVTIGTNGYLSPLLITKTGTISPGSGTESTALKINDSPNIATITNDGLIQASSGIDAGFGVSVYSRAKITNNGVIRGGAGYPHVYSYDGYPNYDVGLGAAGIFIDGSGAHSSILDTGKIYGGSGQLFDGQNGYSGAGVDLFLTTDVKLNVSPTGTIAGGYGGSAYGDSFTGAGIIMDVDTLDNSGLIVGGAGGGAPAEPGTGFRGANPNQGLTGGIGVLVEGGRVLNLGTIAGGAGGSHGERYGGRGGAGLVGIGAHNGPDAIIVNLGTIEGGAGGDGSNSGSGGGDGVRLEENSVLTNYGHIVGGVAGDGGDAGISSGGRGVFMYSGSTLRNFGEISAGAGGRFGEGVYSRGGSILNAGGIHGPNGGYGVALTDGASLVNTGQIAGGAVGRGERGAVGVYVGYSSTLINSGTISGRKDAVVLGDRYAHSASTLVVEKGAVFNGNVVANDFSDILEVSGTSSAALTGIGTQFTGFENISFASGARWTISGNEASLASGEKITGFMAGDGITITDAVASSGTVTVASAGVVSIDAGGVITKLDIAGATVGETNFKFANYTLTESAQPAMSFLFPPAAPTLARALPNLDVLQHFAAAAPTPASFSHAGLPETPMFGVSLDPFFAPHIDAVPIVTLQA